jgi:hypothetical protein
MHTDGAWKEEPELSRLVRKVVDSTYAMVKSSSQHQSVGKLPLREDVAIRCVELHEVGPGGALPNPQHFDGGSVLTIDVMLSAPADFTGGNFCTPEEATSFSSPPDASTVAGKKEIVHAVGDMGEGLGPGEVLIAQRFELGDALAFLSHKRHCVQPVTSGVRRVMVIELWCGEERTCAHRCEHHWGDCKHSRLWAAFSRMVTSSGIEA